MALLGHHELFHRYEQRRRVGKVIASRPVDSFLDLKDGDYVVHVAHGIARFTGMHTMTKDGKSEEYLTLRFADNAVLHVPAARINLVQKYIGGFHGHPHLSRLGSGVWEKQKAKVSEAVMDMAAELLDVQAARAAQEGVAYPPDTEWQKEFEAEFPYEPTPGPDHRRRRNQAGHAKTPADGSAALRRRRIRQNRIGHAGGLQGRGIRQAGGRPGADDRPGRATRAVLSRTAWSNYPFHIESISRFKSAKEQKQTLRRTATGEIDILIGTHRLLSKDVKFADLGLVVIDEEQRFGVTHKERLKQMRRTVDVLTMSATPIPRTLAHEHAGAARHQFADDGPAGPPQHRHRGRSPTTNSASSRRSCAN